MNYKKRDDELIKLNKQARAKANIGNNSGNVGYTENAFRSRKKLPELQNSPNKATTQAYNLTDKGFSGSKSSNTIDFDYVLKNDKFWGNKGMSVGALDIDSDYRRKMGRTESAEDNAKYYQRFGMSKDEVLDQYDKYKRETHPIRTAFEEDFRSAPDRAVTGALGSLAHLAFPHSDLDKMANSDFVQRKNREVQRGRDYVQDSNKLTDTQKAIARGVESGGDFLTNMALAGIAGAPMAIGDAAAGVGALIEPAKWVTPALNGIFNYGSTSQDVKHDLEKQGIDSDTAYNMGNASGAIAGAAGALMMGTGGKAASKGASWLVKALAEGGRIGGISAGQQGLQEIANQLILDNQSTFNNDVQRYVSQGMSEEEAAKQAALNIAARVGGAGATGFIGGAGFSLLGSGLSALGNRNNIPGLTPSGGSYNEYYNNAYNAPNEYMAGGVANSEPLGLPMRDYLPQTENNTLPSLVGNNPLGLPQKQIQPSVIPMPGTNGTIELHDMQALRNNPRVVLPMDEQTKVAAQSRRSTIKSTVALLKDELKGYEGKKRLPKEDKARKEAIQKQIKDLENEDTQLKNQLAGRGTSVKDLLKNDDYDAYNSIYNWKGDESTFARIDNIVKFAGNTPEAKQLGKQIKDSLENYLETGDAKAFVNSGWDKAAYALDAMAKEANLIPFGDVSYADRYGDIWDFLADDSMKIGELAKRMNDKYPQLKWEAPAEANPSAPTSIDPAHELAERYASAFRDFDPYGDMDNMFENDGFVEQMARDISEGKDLSKYIEAIEDVITDAPDVDTRTNMIYLIDRLDRINAQNEPETPKLPELTRSYKDLLPENPYYESEGYRGLSENLDAVTTEIDNLRNTKKQLEELLKKEIVGDKPQDEWTADEYFDSMGYFGRKPKVYTAEGNKIKDSIAKIDKRLNELYPRENEIREGQRGIKDKARQQQLANYIYSNPVAATQSEYPGFDLTKGSNGFAQDAIDNGSAFIAEMSPLDYLKRSAYDIFDTATLETAISGANGMKNLPEYVDAMRRGDRFPIPHLTYDSRYGRGQEGRTRALAAYEAGLDTIPVAILGQPSANPNNTPYVPQRPKSDKLFDLDLQFFARDDKPTNGYWLRLLGDEGFLQAEAQKNNVTPDTLRQYAQYNLGYDNTPKQETKKDNSYWLRLLGDDAFLQSEAAKHNTDPQTLRAYANANMGYGEAPKTAPKKEKRTFFDDSLPKGEKTSQYYKNTMRRTEENAKMSDEEYHAKFNENEYKYTPHTDAESEREGYSFIKDAGGHDAAVQKILNTKYDENSKPFSHVEVDATHILADRAEKEARELEAQGLDATAKWLEADRLHKKLKSEMNRSASAMQANQKWIKKTPRGALDDILSKANKTIDKKKSKGYTDMVDKLADDVEDAIRNGKDTQSTLDDIKKAFDKNKGDYDTDKYEEMVLNLVGGEGKNKIGSAEMAAEVARLIKKKMGVSTLTRKEERAILNLLEEASHYEVGSRSFNELRSQAMKILDNALPSTIGDKIKSIWYDNMLASLKTMFTRNLGGNIGANAIENIATPIQVGSDWLVGKVTGNRTRTLTTDALTEGVKGLGKGGKDWWLDVKKNTNTVRSGQDSLSDVLNTVHSSFKPNDNKILNGLNKAGSIYDRVVRKGMELGDRPIYEAKYAATKAELEAVVDKFGEEGIRKSLPQTMNKKATIDDVIEFIAVNDALEAVLQNNTEMKEGMKAAKQWLEKTGSSMMGVDNIGTLVMPFIEVSGNMVDRYFQYTPFGVVGNILRSVKEKRKFGSVNQRRMTGEMGRNILGGLLTAGAMGLAAGKYISDPYSDDKDEKKRQQLSDYQEYALQKKDGSAQKDMSDVPIFGPKLREGKMLYDAYKEGGVPELVKTMPDAVGSATLDTLFQGMNKVTGGNTKYSNDEGNNFVGNTFEALKSMPPSVFIPSFVRQTAQFLDPYKRDLGDYGTNEYYKNLFINGLPVLRETRLEPKINTAGENVKQFGDETGLKRFIDAYISPWRTTHPNENISDAMKYADELKEQTNGEYNPQMPVFNAGDLKKIKGYDADNYSREDLMKFDKEFYATNDELANALINDEWYKSLPYDKQARYLDTLYSNNSQVMKEKFVRGDLTDEDIEKMGDDLYAVNDRLAKILRDDDGSHEEMFNYFHNIDAIENLADKYGYKMQYDTYVKWETDPEKKALGGAEKYASVYNKAKELGLTVDNYLKKEKEKPGSATEYSENKKKVDAFNQKHGTEISVTDYLKKQKTYDGGAEQWAKDRQAAEKAGIVDKNGHVQADDYRKIMDRAGSQSAKMERDLPALVGMGLPKTSYYVYANAINYNPSIQPSVFGKTYKAIDTNTENAMTQEELLNYINKNYANDYDKANDIWYTYGEWTNKKGQHKKIKQGKNGYTAYY